MIHVGGSIELSLAVGSVALFYLWYRELVAAEQGTNKCVQFGTPSRIYFARLKMRC